MYSLHTAMIGSLPVVNTDLALQMSLRLDIPTLPQLPRLNPTEFMLAQVLDGFPGLVGDPEGKVQIDPAQWRKQDRRCQERLEAAIADPAAGLMDPAPHQLRAWRPFLWELEQRRPTVAKIQCAGPLTVGWAVRLTDGRPLQAEPEIAAQALRWVLARALGMAAAVAATEVRPLVFLDEPGLFALDLRDPVQRLELAQLRLTATALRRMGALVGVHCCGNTDWGAILELPIDVVSADAQVSLDPLLSLGPSLDSYIERGGWLALGVIPTSNVERIPPETLVSDLFARLGGRADARLRRSILTPACGLALHSIPAADQVIEDLLLIRALIKARVEGSHAYS